MQRDIIVYCEPPAEVGALRVSLSETFGDSADTEVRYMGARELADDTLFADPGTAIIYPGAPHGDGYRAQFAYDGFRRRREHIENGGAALLLCAAFYQAIRSYSFLTDDGVLKRHQSPYHLFNGSAHGPIRELVAAEKRWGGSVARHDVAMVTFEDENGTEHETGLCLSKGPLITLDEDEECDVIARFRDLEGRPPAIIGKRIGSGYAVGAAVGIEIDGNLMQRLISPGDVNLHGQTRRDVEDNLRFASELARFHTERDLLWNLIWNKRLLPV